MFGYNPPGPSAPVALIATPIEPDGNLSVPYFIIECKCGRGRNEKTQFKVLIRI